MISGGKLNVNPQPRYKNQGNTVMVFPYAYYPKVLKAVYGERFAQVG